MPKGPSGQKRPADVIGAAIRVARIATGEDEEDKPTAKGKAGGDARAEKLSPSERKRIAEKAAKHRWEGEETPTQEETS